MATESPVPIDEIIRTVGDGLAERGWGVRHIESSPLPGRLIATDLATGEEREVDVLKEACWAPPTVTEYGPVLMLDDVIGAKVRALTDRGAVRDLIDVHAVAQHRSTVDLETSAVATPASSAASTTCAIASLARNGGMTRTYYGPSPEQVEDLRAWALPGPATSTLGNTPGTTRTTTDSPAQCVALLALLRRHSRGTVLGDRHQGMVTVTAAPRSLGHGQTPFRLQPQRAPKAASAGECALPYRLWSRMSPHPPGAYGVAEDNDCGPAPLGSLQKHGCGRRHQGGGRSRSGLPRPWGRSRCRR